LAGLVAGGMRASGLGDYPLVDLTGHAKMRLLRPSLRF
jgi:hypothetical protein